MNTMITEERYDLDATDFNALDLDSTEALVTLARKWQVRATPIHPVTARARRREANIRAGWKAMAALRARADHAPFPLVRPKLTVDSAAMTTWSKAPRPYRTRAEQQAEGAEIFQKAALAAILKDYPGHHLVCQIHDEFLIERD